MPGHEEHSVRRKFVGFCIQFVDLLLEIMPAVVRFVDEPEMLVSWVERRIDIVRCLSTGSAVSDLNKPEDLLAYLDKDCRESRRKGALFSTTEKAREREQGTYSRAQQYSWWVQSA